MNSPIEEKKAILNQLKDYEKIINPTNDLFFHDLTHPLCPERDRLIGVFYEYTAYERWFGNRHPDIMVQAYIEGATAIQSRIYNAVVGGTV